MPKADHGDLQYHQGFISEPKIYPFSSDSTIIKGDFDYCITHLSCKQKDCVSKEIINLGHKMPLSVSSVPFQAKNYFLTEYKDSFHAIGSIVDGNILQEFNFAKSSNLELKSPLFGCKINSLDKACFFSQCDSADYINLNFFSLDRQYSSRDSLGQNDFQNPQTQEDNLRSFQTNLTFNYSHAITQSHRDEEKLIASVTQMRNAYNKSHFLIKYDLEKNIGQKLCPLPNEASTVKHLSEALLVTSYGNGLFGLCDLRCSQYIACLQMRENRSNGMSKISFPDQNSREQHSNNFFTNIESQIVQIDLRKPAQMSSVIFDLRQFDMNQMRASLIQDYEIIGFGQNKKIFFSTEAHKVYSSDIQLSNH